MNEIASHSGDVVYLVPIYTRNNWIVHFVSDGDIVKKCYSSQIIIIETMEFTLYFSLGSNSNIFNFQSFSQFHCNGPIDMLKCRRKSLKSNKLK